jgi:hypothetical protein
VHAEVGLFGGGGFAGVGGGYLAAEAFDAACGVDQLLLAGKERVAGGADFDDDVALVGGAGLKCIAAGALDVDGFVLRVNTFFWHGSSLFGGMESRRNVACRLAVRLQRVGSPSHRLACRGSPQSLCYLPGWPGYRDTMAHYPHFILDSHMEQSDSLGAWRWAACDTWIAWPIGRAFSPRRIELSVTWAFGPGWYMSRRWRWEHRMVDVAPLALEFDARWMWTLSSEHLY